MINGIGLSTGSAIGIGTPTPTQRSDAAGTTAKLPAASQEDQGAVSTTVSQIAALGAPVDVDRIASIKSAIKGGRYSIDPDAIAQKMIATDLGAGA